MLDEERRRGLLDGRRLREMRTQEIDKCAPKAASVISLNFHALQESEDAEDIGIANSLHASGLLELFSVFVDRELHAAKNGSGYSIGRTSFVYKSALQRPVRGDHAFERFLDIGIDRAWSLERGAEQMNRDPEQQRFLLTQKFLGDADIGMRERGGIGDRGLLALAALLQVLAFKRTVDGLFPFHTAANGANIATDTGTKPARFSNFTNPADDPFDTLIVSLRRRCAAPTVTSRLSWS
jgi:hypothetical protein